MFFSNVADDTNIFPFCLMSFLIIPCLGKGKTEETTC